MTGDLDKYFSVIEMHYLEYLRVYKGIKNANFFYGCPMTNVLIRNDSLASEESKLKLKLKLKPFTNNVTESKALIL